MSMRILGAVAATILASSLATSLVACTAEDKEPEVSTAKAASAASVSIDLLDADGNKVGDAVGVLIAPRVVLTSGHSISGKYKWNVTSADGKTKVTGSRGMTYDWMEYDSLKAHPRRHDIGVIHLDAPIKLDAYPRLAGKPADGSEAMRVRSNGASFEHLPAIIAKHEGAPTSFLADAKGGETLTTGGVVYNRDGIIGVISGRGMTTGKLYIARTDQLNAWLGAKVSCGGSVKATYAEAEKKAPICDENGNPINPQPGSSTSGNPSSSSSSSNSSSSDSGGSCENNNDGVCSGSCGGGVNTTAPQGSSGDDDDDSTTSTNNGDTSDSSETSSGSSGTNPNKGSGGDTGSSANGSGGVGSGGESGSGSSTGVGSSGSNGNKGSSNGGSNGGGAGGESGSGKAGSSTANRTGGTGKGHDASEGCQGANDNPEVCPPEPDGCRGSKCGGGKPDDMIDYGNCGCGNKSSKGKGEYKVH